MRRDAILSVLVPIFLLIALLAAPLAYVAADDDEEREARTELEDPGNHPGSPTGVMAEIEFEDDGSTLKITGEAEGLTPGIPYGSLIYDIASPVEGPFACEPGIFDPSDPNFILLTMFVGLWDVDSDGEGELSATNIVDDATGERVYVPLDKIATISIRDFTVNDGFGPEAVVACGELEVEDDDDEDDDVDVVLMVGYVFPEIGVPGAVNRYDAETGAFIDLFVPPGTGGLAETCCPVIGPDENLYLPSILDSRVLRYDGVTGEFIDEFVSSGSGGLFFPIVLVFGPDENLYVGSLGTDSILRYDGETGAFIDAFVPTGSGGLTGFLDPQVFLFGPDGNLYVASPGTNSVLRYDGTSGAFIDAFVSPGSGGLDGPVGLAFGSDDNLYVGSVLGDSVLRYDGETGEFIDVFVAPGSGGLDEPVGIGFGPEDDDDEFFFVASVGTTNSILRYDAETGEFVDVFVPVGSGGLFGPRTFVFVELDDDDDDKDDDDDANGDLSDQLEAAGDAIERYEDLEDALADGYVQVTPCEELPGVGAQGFHYVNPALLDGVLDPTKPEILQYIPSDDDDDEGELELVGAEYAVPFAVVPPGGPSPTLFGQHFHHGPPGVPLWLLHAWVLEDVPNPSGVFADWNPNLSCAGDGDDDDEDDD